MMKMREVKPCSDTINDEASLRISFKNGNKEAFARLYTDYIDLLSNDGLRFSTDREMVQDGIHDMFTDLWRNRAHLSDIDNISGYLLKALYNDQGCLRRWLSGLGSQLFKLKKSPDFFRLCG